MVLRTKRLLLRPWEEKDARSLFAYAKDPEVGPAAGWPPHTSVEESRQIIQTVLSRPQCFAICLQEDQKAIGAVELMVKDKVEQDSHNENWELGYWIGKPFWGKGYVPEAAEEVLRYAFEEMHLPQIWCRYYDGNERSKKVQEKLGFVYHHTCSQVEVPLLKEIRMEHSNCLTKEKWKQDRTL